MKRAKYHGYRNTDAIEMFEMLSEHSKESPEYNCALFMLYKDFPNIVEGYAKDFERDLVYLERSAKSLTDGRIKRGITRKEEASLAKALLRIMSYKELGLEDMQAVVFNSYISGQMNPTKGISRKILSSNLVKVAAEAGITAANPVDEMIEDTRNDFYNNLEIRFSSFYD